jgi:poly-gamma-glutamate capsule biosynthesis protein CapA/YwtB (metallophosphatase superfamily)
MRFLVGFAFVLLVALGASLARESHDRPLAEPMPTSQPTSEPTSPVGGSDAPEATAQPTDSPTSPPVSTPQGPTHLTMVFTGEVLSHGAVIRQADADAPGPAYDYVPMFAKVAPLLEAADFAVCHVETPISSDNTNLSGYPVFNAPRELAAGLAASGYDGCSTASNHSMDKGPSGIVSTLNQLEAAGIPWAGMARSAEEAAKPTLYDVGGVTVGHLSYTYGLNGYVLPADKPYLVDVTQVDTVLADAAAAKAAGADIVILSIQWGAEYQHDPTELQIEQANAFLASPDIDLIVGAHVHVIQPVDVVNGKWVAYGVGNFLSNQSTEAGLPDASQNGIMLFVEITGTEADGYKVSNLSFVPTRVDRTDYTIVPLPVALADPNLDPAVRARYEAVVASTTEVVNRRGAGLSITDIAALEAAAG